MNQWDAVWLWDNSASAYVSNTNNAASSTAFELWGQTADVLYLGFSRETKGGVFTLTTNGSYGAFTWQFWNGSAWTTVIPIVGYTFTTSKYILLPVSTDWQPRTFSATDPHAGAAPDSISRYWWRVTTASVTTAAQATRCYSIPEISYSTPTLAYQLLQFKQDFTNTSTPSRRAVIELIKRAESKINYRTRKAWNWNIENVSENTQLQLADYNRWGIAVRKVPILDVYSVAIWNGGCLTKDTLIPTDLGITTIDKVNGNILTYDFKSNSLIPVMGKSVFNGINSVYELTTRKKILEATDNHKFIVVEWC